MVERFRSAIAANKLAYDDPESVKHYERERFTGLYGRGRDRREIVASRSAIQQFMRDSTVLDCPCGNGRWFSRLALRAKRIVGIDVAPAMLAVASTRSVAGVEIDVREGDAEKLDLPDDAVEHVFCFALMKHLPRQTKLNVLREFARVSSGRMAVSFCIFNPASKLTWRARGSHGYPVSRAELDSLVAEAGLSVGAVYSVGVPVLGLEAIVVLERT